MSFFKEERVIPNEHLSFDQIRGVARTGASSLPAAASAHLGECRQCTELVKFVNGLGYMKSDSENDLGDCPSQVVLLEIAEGLTVPDTSLYRHIAQCHRCVATLREFGDDLKDDNLPEIKGLETAGPEWQRALAGKIANSARTKFLGPRRVRHAIQFALRTRWFYAVATGVVFCLAVVSWSLWRSRPSYADRLLAQAYTGQRNMEMRIAGAAYSPMATQRGGEARRGNDLALLKAKVMIESELAAHSNDSGWLAAQGRAFLLEGQFQKARQSLEHALQVSPNSLDVLTDLATADFEIAESEGHDELYITALGHLDEVMRAKPDDPISLFNRAILYERIGSLPLAIEDWEHYLRLDPQSDWASQEVRQRLDRLKRLMKSRPSAQTLPAEPLEAVAWLEKRIRGEPVPDSLSAGALDEAYLEIAVTQWLPALFPAGTAAAPRDKAPEWRALRLLADVLEGEHGNRWLRDFLAGPPSANFTAGVRALSQAVQTNAAGDPIAAGLHAKQAERFFRDGGNLAGQLRSRLESVYALHRALQARQCLRAAEPLGKELERRSYVWANIQLSIEQAICWVRIDEFDRAERASQRALAISQRSRYGNLYLRSLGTAAGTEGDRGNARAAWHLDGLGLKEYWAGFYPAVRAYQFVSDMRYAAEAASQWNVAESLEREAVMYVTAGPNRSLEAMARYRLASAARLAGLAAEAKEEFEHSRKLFDQLPDNQANRAYKMSDDLSLAELEAQSSLLDDALARLLRVGPQLGEVNDDAIALQFYRTLGQVKAQQSNPTDAEHALWTAVRIAELGLRSLATDRDRLVWDAETRDAYRALVRLEHDYQHDPEVALDLWEWYRASPVRAAASRNSGHPAANQGRTKAVEYLVSSEVRRSLAIPQVSRVLPSLSTVTIFSYAEFSDGIVIWAFDDRGVESSWSQVPAGEFERVARRFAEQCADPRSSLPVLQRDARQLYQWLIAPMESRLTAGRTLAFETDGAVSQVPLQALVDSSGVYLGSRYQILLSPGVGYLPRLRQPAVLKRRQRALVVGAPKLAGDWASLLAPLPDADREAREVASLFDHAQLISGASATPEAVARGLPRAEVFHFAGHALSDGRRHGLLLTSRTALGPADDSGARLMDTDSINPARVRRCQLVVLSACATAMGENLVDPESLVRAFLLAGVPQVVASRWDVDSATTAAFMDVFYAELLSGTGVAGSLHAAAERIRSHPETSHPYYWAPFNLFGRP